MDHELKHIIGHHFQRKSGFRGLTDRFCNHIEGASSEKIEFGLPGVHRSLPPLCVGRRRWSFGQEILDLFLFSTSAGRPECARLPSSGELQPHLLFLCKCIFRDSRNSSN
jgi:hypothetical protein